eukprot:GEMP01044072.1.p1 GENE.GEMP01044072.1~~GEMP01044072.1.p1  ORF type:complete len:389 (-),score=90.10 GEMP01044072.1:561-1727(-)
MDQSRFVRQAIAEGVRGDMRNREDFREVTIDVERFGQVDVRLGKTRILASTTAEVVAPNPDRPGEGSISFNVEFGPMAGPEFELGRPSPLQHIVRQRIEKLLRGSQAIDNEALCIVAGERVWSIRVDIRAVSNDGNLGDAASIAALASLVSFRKPDVEFRGTATKVFTDEEREPIPLPIHHLPFPTTITVVNGTWLVDPSYEEEAVSTGSILIGANKHGELCFVHAAGQPVSSAEVLGLYAPIAVRRAIDLHEMLQSTLDLFTEEHRRRRMKRMKRAPSEANFLDTANAQVDRRVDESTSSRKQPIPTIGTFAEQTAPAAPQRVEPTPAPQGTSANAATAQAVVPMEVEPTPSTSSARAATPEASVQTEVEIDDLAQAVVKKKKKKKR